MCSEISDAFAHPEARAKATAAGQPLDRISLRDHIVEVEIGAFTAERGVTQRLCFNVVVEVITPGGDIADDVDRILSYDRVSEAIAHALAAERLNLLETLAENVAGRILREPQAQRVFVRIEKLDRGPGALGVEIVRTRGGQEIAASQTPHPVIAFLGAPAWAAGRLTQVVDALRAGGAPLILCVGLPDGQRPVAGNADAQRRIDLLAIEQNGWTVAARDPRCAVVGTRTELDWAMKNDRISVWAPSKIVLDAVDGPGDVSDPVALAMWFAGHMQAAEFVCVDAALPARLSGAEIPMRRLEL
ncbi:MAG: dihydroneopterin aldolase [Rhodobacter sp.]|nr:dihydroneopterin aldolase [Rhodobacter sp.]